MSLEGKNQLVEKTSFPTRVYIYHYTIRLSFSPLGNSKALLLLIATRRYPSILPLSLLPSLSLGYSQTSLEGPILLPTLLLSLYSLLRVVL